MSEYDARDAARDDFEDRATECHACRELVDWSALDSTECPACGAEPLSPEIAALPVLLRSQLLTAAETTIDSYELEYGVSAPESLKAAVREVARTAMMITPWWEEVVAHQKCGCLVGTARISRGLEPEPGLNDDDDEAADEHLLGCGFPSALVEAGIRLADAYRVVED